LLGLGSLPECKAQSQMGCGIKRANLAIVGPA
jgi:hypothetical protein